MLKSLLGKSKGFTLIEVVIVLAIAGLIFVIVFLAVGQAQATRRVTSRKDFANRIAAAADQYASNTSGAYPASGWNPVTASYVTAEGLPETPAFTTTPPATEGQYYFTSGQNCTGSSARAYKVVAKIEKSGTYCVDNE